MADEILQGVLLSRKETKTLKQLKDMGNVKVPVQKKDINYYLVALEEFLQEEAVTFYLDTANGDDSNSGLSRSKPMKTVAAVVARAKDSAPPPKIVKILVAISKIIGYIKINQTYSS